MKIVCLNCITGFDSNRVEWKMPDGKSYVPDAPARRTWRKVSEFIEGTSVDDSRAEAVTRIAKGLTPHCPKNGCRIPTEMVKRATKVIGIVGEPGSSKTSVLTSMFERASVNRKLADRVDFTLTAHSHLLWKTARDRQFRDRTPLEGTTIRQGVDQPEETTNNTTADNQHNWSGLNARQPIVVEASSARGNVNFVFLDLAGEDALTAQNAAEVSPHLAIADHLWFFLTPNLNSDVVEELSHHAPPDVVKNLYDVDEHNQDHSRTKIMIREIAKLWKAANGLHPDSHVGRPRIHVTAILAKADLLSTLRQDPKIEQLVARIAPPSDWVTNSSAPADLMDSNQIDNRSADTSELVRLLYPQLYNSIVKNFPEAIFLPVAAVGSVAKTRYQDTSHPERYYSQIKPFGVVDLFFSMILATDELKVK